MDGLPMNDRDDLARAPAPSGRLSSAAAMVAVGLPICRLIAPWSIWETLNRATGERAHDRVGAPVRCECRREVPVAKEVLCRETAKARLILSLGSR